MARCLAILLLLLSQAVPAKAAYVFYHRVIGDWTIVCWRSDATAIDDLCRLSAPPASLANRERQNVVVVHEYRANTYQVAIEIRDTLVEGQPVFLRVDSYAVHETVPEGRLARWSGKAALDILSEMRVGRSMVYRVQTVPDGLPHDTRVSVEGFAEALSVYRRVIRQHGLLSGSK